MSFLNSASIIDYLSIQAALQAKPLIAVYAISMAKLTDLTGGIIKVTLNAIGSTVAEMRGLVVVVCRVTTAV